MRKLDEPLNASERYLHGIAIRLDALCDMMSSFLNEYAKENSIPVQENIIEEVISDVEDNIDYNSFNVSDIKKILDEKEIKYTSTMRKSELIELLK